MNMIELLGGIVVGAVAGATLKDKITGEASQLENAKKQLDSLYKENEKFARRNKELERQCEDQLAEIKKLQRKAKEADNDSNDLEDDLQDAKKTVARLRTLNDQLTSQLQDYKRACEAQEVEIASLKEKLG